MNQYRWALPQMVIAMVLLGGSLPLAQQKPGSAAEPKLAIEIIDGRKRPPAPVFESSSDGGVMEMGPTKPLAGWKQPEKAVPLTRIRIRSRMAGEAVRIEVAAVLDDFEPVNAPGPKYGPVEKPVGSYLAPEGETVSITELTNFGFEPLVLRIVKAEPRIEYFPPSSIPPQVINNLKSVEVVSLALAVGQSNSYTLTVRNISTKNIVALDVYQPAPRGRSSVTAGGDESRPVMKPGASYETMVSQSRGGRMTDHGYVPEQPSHQVVIGTVVFDDETYEGEAEIAVRVIGEKKGRRLQLARALPLLQRILESPDRDPTATLDKLRSDVSELRIDADSQTVEDLARRFPELPLALDRNNLTSIIMRGLMSGRTELLYQIKDIEEAIKRNPNSDGSMWQRLNSFKEQLEIQAKENELSR